MDGSELYGTVLAVILLAFPVVLTFVAVWAITLCFRYRRTPQVKR